LENTTFFFYKDLLAILSRDLLVNVLIAILLSVILGWFASREWIENFASETAIPTWISIVTGLVIITVVWFTVSYHAFRAACKIPIEVRRYE